MRQGIFRACKKAALLLVLLSGVASTYATGNLVLDGKIFQVELNQQGQLTHLYDAKTHEDYLQLFSQNF